jgi:glutamate 5-kinase
MKKKLVVIKIGTRVLTNSRGALDLSQVSRLSDEVAELVSHNWQVVLVSSGAIGAGRGRMKRGAPTRLTDKQALASIGQGLLMHAYSLGFKKHNLTVAQVLLTGDDLADRKRYVNVRNTLLTLIKWGVIPIINENDTIAVDEIKVGDNDRLSALVAGKIGADLLVILTDVDGLYIKEPNGRKRLVKRVETIDKELLRHAWSEVSSFGTGGMVTKLEAASIALAAGCEVVITNGRHRGNLTGLASGKYPGTRFTSSSKRPHALKQWLAFSARPQGSIVVDDGCVSAIVDRKKSVLASGVTEVRGKFSQGAVISIFDMNRHEIARGRTNYSSSEISKIKGLRSNEIKSYLERPRGPEVLHCDLLAIIPAHTKEK